MNTNEGSALLYNINEYGSTDNTGNKCTRGMCSSPRNYGSTGNGGNSGWHTRLSNKDLWVDGPAMHIKPTFVRQFQY